MVWRDIRPISPGELRHLRFAHLMIALCRAINIPARFVSGIDYGAAAHLGPPDFHAYVEVFLGDRWYLFDPTGITAPRSSTAS